MKKKYITPLLVFVFAATLFSWHPVRVSALSGRVLISEVKLGGSQEPKEFVELYNDSSNSVDLSTFTVEYAKAGFASNSCGASSWKAVASPSSLVNAKVLSGTLLPGQFLIVELAMNDAVSGSLHVVQIAPNTTSTHDVAGWGNARPCFMDIQADTPLNGSVLQRGSDLNGLPIAGAGFAVTTQSTPGSGLGGVSQDPPSEPITYNIQITELLPNPASPKSDTQDEYIELYNPYDVVVDLTGYSLHSGSASSAYEKFLEGISLAPHQYLALYAKDTGLTLVNSSAGQAWLVAPNNVRVSETAWYPDDLGEDVAWASVDGSWQSTTSLTPGAPNHATAGQPGSDTSEAPEPCPASKFRNPETNRCKTITNNNEAVTPCAANQERNPATNRCRKVAASNTELAACQTGYERNPDTNRCRKITAVKASFTQMPNKPSGSHINYLILLGIASVICGYGIYEYRKDIVVIYQRLAKHLKRNAK